jgi:Holliday junction resolvasome RuvABC endonuclease subunit
MFIAGLDLSKNHYGLVVKEYGQLDITVKLAAGVQETKARAKWPDNPDVLIHLLPPKGDTEQSLFDMSRCQLLPHVLSEALTQLSGYGDDLIVALEGYAYSESPFSVIPMAEITGVVKFMLFTFPAAIRVHDPMSVKMWAGKGNYKKEDMLKQALRFISIPKFLQTGKADAPAYDIADAYFLMNMLEFEIKVRRGEFDVSRLSENRVQVFNRITKHYSINLLNRPFLAKSQPILKHRVIRRIER